MSNKKIIIALSGGPDSVALLHKLKQNKLLTLLAVHFNHNLRENAKKDEAFVIDLCKKLSVPLKVINLNVIDYVKEHKTSTEEGARELRYSHLYKILQEENFDYIALGHNLNDKCETILMNITRGTGIDGLNGLKEETNKIIRPLINTTKAEIYEYLKENNLSYCTDETNFENNYTRNKFRNIIIPSLLEINPNLFNSLSRLSTLAKDNEDYMNMETKKALESYDNSISMLNSYPKALKYRLIKELIFRVKKTTKDITYKEIERIDNFLIDGSDFKTYLDTGQLYAEGKNNIFSIKEKKEILKPQDFNYKITSEKTFIKELNIFLIVKKADKIKYSNNRFYFNGDIDFNAINIQTNLKLRPLGMKGSRKISDILKDKKIPIETRYNNIILMKDKTPLWIPGVIISEYGKCKNPSHYIEVEN